MSTAERSVAKGHRPLYSVARAIIGDDPGYEREVSDELLKAARSQRDFRSHGGVLIPPAALFASLTTTGVQSGKELVFRSPVGAVPARHPIPQLAQLGATFLFDVRDLVGYIWLEDGYQVEWQASEVPAGVTPTDFVLGSDQPDASTGAIQAIITRRLAAQSTPSVDELIERDITAAVASAIDQGGVSGTGAGGQPLGLLARGLKTVSAATLDYAAVTGAEHYVGSKNEAALDTAWLGSIGARAALRGAFVGSTGGPVWAFDDTILGRPAAASTIVTPDALIHGPFATLLVAIHAIELLTDVITRARQGEIAITAFVTLSVALAHPDNWIVYTGFTVPAVP